MTPVPLELPLRPAEAAEVANLIFDHAEGKPLSGDVRNRLAARAAALKLQTISPYFGSLERDPVHHSVYYLAIDASTRNPLTFPLLLHIALAAAPTSSIYYKALLIGRMRRSNGSEMVINAIPFGPHARQNVEIFAARINPAFYPGPQGARTTITVEEGYPAAFDTFHAIQKRTGKNFAALAGDYHAAMHAAIRAGWRAGYTAEADHFIVAGSTEPEITRSVEIVKEAIRHAAGYTKFTTDTSRLFELESDPRHPHAWSAATVEERFHQVFPAEEARWIQAEFSRPFQIAETTYRLGREEVLRLAVKFGRSLKLNEELFDCIRAAKAGLRGGADFDFEPSLDEAETLTTAKELLFCMHWLKARGRAAQLVPPNLGFKKRQAYPVKLGTTSELGVGLEDYSHHKMWPELVPAVVRDFQAQPLAELAARVAELAAVARFFDGTLSIHSGSGKQAEVLECIGQATRGRVNYKISGELQLQLLDVLSEQPAASPWRQLFERMVKRTNEFAAQGAFGAESELAAQYVKMGREFYLGDAARGRVDGNLFLVFWLGNVVGSHDQQAPDGDHRFFKEKLDEMPDDLLTEVRKRNSHYIVWLAEHLQRFHT